MALQHLKQEMAQLLSEVEEQITFRPKQLFVVGCSTSEVLGEKIGTAGAVEVANALYDELECFVKKHNLYLVFQGC